MAKRAPEWDKTSIWSRTSPQLSPMDLVVGTVPPSEVKSFIKASVTAYSAVKQAHPDVVFVPERGAGPIAWCIQQQADMEENPMRYVYLPIGQHTEVLGGKLYGITKTEKAHLINRALEFEKSLSTINNPLIVDEAQSGSTISTAVRYLYSGLTTIHNCEKLSVIAMLDTYRKGREKVGPFNKLATNSLKEDITTSTIPAPLFYVDKQALLDHILFPDDAPESGLNSRGQQTHRIELMMLMHNIPARDFFQMMTLAYIKPEYLARSLNSLKTNGDFDYSGIPTDQLGYAHRLHEWTLDVSTAPSFPPYKTASGQQSEQWLRSYLNCSTPNPASSLSL